MKAHYYTISGGFASRERLPIIIQAAELAETAKAIYLYGGGSIEHSRRVGRCCRCGRALTHPGSIVLGIGPECLGNWDMRDIVLNDLTKADIEALTIRIRAQQKVDGWVPKAVVLDKEDAPDMEVPPDHRMLQKPTVGAKPSVEKTNAGLVLRFAYDPEKVAAVKTITGRRWSSEKKIWTVPHTKQAVEVLRKIGLEAPEVEAPKAPKRSEINMAGFGRQLMPFQREGVEFLMSKNGRAIIGDEMGLGKTIQALAYIHANPDKRPALVICPASLKLNWEREAQIACPTLSTHIISGKKSERLSKADIYIINYDIVANRLADLISADIKTMVLDEFHYCFPAGTPVNTPNGLIAIEKLKCGQMVYNATGIGEIKSIMKRESAEIVSLFLSNGKSISCTPEHLFFTEDGWIPAYLCKGKKLFTRKMILDILYCNNISKNRGNKNENLNLRRMQKTIQEKGVSALLFKKLRSKKRKQPPGSERKESESNQKRTDRKKMRILWEFFFRPSLFKKEVLQSILLSEMENGAGRLQEKTVCRSDVYAGSTQQNNERSAQKTSQYAGTNIKKNEREQPYKTTRSSRKDKKILGKKWGAPYFETTNTWRKWEGSASSPKGIICSFGEWLESRVCNTNKKEKPISNKLQSGFSFSRKENMGRIKRMVTQLTGNKKERQKKTTSVAAVRVERLVFQECRSDTESSKNIGRNKTVYNIEVSGHPSYFVNNFLVHNCKNKKAKRTKAIVGISKKAPGLSYIDNIIGLSGTPILNRPVEIYPVAKMLAPADIPPFMSFAMRYCGAKHNGFGWDFAGSSNTEELHDLLTSTCLPYETMICTESGPKEIGHVVEYKIKEKVMCYDFISASIQWRQIQSYGAYETPNRMVRIQHEFGELCCTPDHKIWTEEKGYVRAEEITSGLSLSVVPQTCYGYSKRKANQRQVLLNKMCGLPPGTHRGSKMENEIYPLGSKKNQITREEVFVLSKNNRSQKKLLFNKLLQKMVHTESNRKYESCMEKRGGKITRTKEDNYPGGYTRVEKGCRDKKGKISIQGSTKKNVRGAESPLVEDKGGRSNSKGMENFSMGTASTYNNRLAGRMPRICHPSHTSNRAFSKSCTLPHIRRFSISRTKTSHRSRRPISPGETTKKQGPMERERTQKSRVVSVTIYQPRNRREFAKNNKRNKVYDIQVEGVHNYFANRCLVHNCMIRHLKADVLKELPDKTRTVMPMEMENTISLEYRKASANFIQWLKSIDPEKVSAAQRAETLVQFQALKRLAARGKWESMLEWIKDTLNTNGKLLLFAVHHEAIDNLMEALKGYNPVKIDGRDSQEARQSAVDRFQNDEACRVFVGNIKAAGVGLTLTAADTVVFTELGWTPGEHVQAEDRAHRIGQKNAVSVYYLIAQGTIEEEIAALLDKKQKVLDAVLDGAETSQESLLTELFNKYINESKKVLTN